MGLVIENRDLLYGLPHIDCHYVGRTVNGNRLDEDALCICCKRKATNAHHFPPKGMSPTRERCGYVLRPALFAVCGSGTTGCHNGWHMGNRYTAQWQWDDLESAEKWESGELLEEYGPHSPKLYLHGRWVITDKKIGYSWEVRRDG